MFDASLFPALEKSVVERFKAAPAWLTYHHLAHTLDVARQAERIAGAEGIEEHEILLLKVAALFHDIGYPEGPKNHEERGCAFFSSEAALWNFSNEEIEQINQIILATRMPQTPKSKLEEIICDADLDYLGRDDFFSLGKELKKEFLHFNIVKNDDEWRGNQLRFLEKHRYFTPSQNSLREPVKQRNILKLRVE